MEDKDLRASYYRYLRYFLAKDETTATSYDKYMALAYAVRSELVDRWIDTQKRYHSGNLRRVYFLSMEYVFGKSLFQNMFDLNIEEPLMSAVRSLGFSADDLYQQEDDFDLGNGGKGRTAACFMESMSSLDIPVMGYGLRYDYAQFQQELRNGLQFERPYDWLHRGHAWEIVRPEYSCTIGFAGEIAHVDKLAHLGPYQWHSTEQVYAVPYDVPIPGYRNHTVNTLRLWSARPSEEFLPDYVNHGDYIRACEEKSVYSRITKVLFPEEDVRRATELRIKQQYFFVSAAIQDIIRRYKMHNSDINDLDKKVVIQLNGSRCALAIPEMMRMLIDQENVSWERAWEMTQNIFAYTSHAVLRDNLEVWPLYKMGQILPRHVKIIEDINQIHLDKIRARQGASAEVIRELSLIEEGEVKRIRLADLAVIGSFSVNGVSREQTEILRKRIFPQFAVFFPDRFNVKTAGIAHRRWLTCANEPLAKLITGAIGNSWVKDAENLRLLEQWSDNQNFLMKLSDVKKEAKKRLAGAVYKTLKVRLDESVMFDIQSRNIHLSKRQTLHVLHILHRYLRLKRGEKCGCPRLHIFAGKASPSDFLAKQIIHLINVTADLVNNDSSVNSMIRVLFIPNFGMSWAEKVVPAADLSEQISTASLESSGTFNMKFAFNGAVTVASRSGSNIEMFEHIGKDFIFPFGKTSDELIEMQDYRPSDLIAKDPRLKEVLTLIESLLPNVYEGSAIYPLLASLRDSDRQFVLLDFGEYVERQEQIEKLYGDPIAWSRAGLMNIARIGWFSSDRAVTDYARDVWKVKA